MNKNQLELSVDKENLQKFEKEILSRAKNVKIVEIEEEENLRDDEQEHKIVILDMISKISDKKEIKKRGINPKYRAASMAFFGAILNNKISKKGLRRRGKRSVDGNRL